MIDDKMFETQIAMNRLSMMSDWQELSSFDSRKMLKEIEPFKNDWKKYNPKKEGNNRWGLSVTSLDGGLSGVPDLTSLLDYEKQTGITLHNHDLNTPTDVWKKNNHTTSKEYAGWHPTQKPVALLERIIKANSNEGDVVLDVFNGSASTTIACNKTNRTFWGCEFDKEYYEKCFYFRYKKHN